MPCIRSLWFCAAMAFVASNSHWASSVAGAAETAETSVSAEVSLVLEDHCLSCHGEGPKPKAGLDLSSWRGIEKGALSGPVIVPGKANESLLIQAVKPEGSPHMPPKGQLSDEEIATLKQWIDKLAPVSLGRTITEEDRAHWAFRKSTRVAPPKVKDTTWIRTSIDPFILARLEQAGLQPAPPANPAVLLRRAYFDLIGLPPTPEEMQAFLADPSPEAYEKVLDQLLASPQYGERWGRYWLDLARYADSGGFHDDIHRPNAWRYRDYVIASFNADKPYPQFIAEQLAGDEIAPNDPQALIATGFCRNGPSNDGNMGKGKELEKYRLDELDDVISTTSSVFLGLTLGCARCHDHKYDPILQQDYYSFLAVFNNTIRKNIPLTPEGELLLEPEISKDPKTKKSPDAPAAMAMIEVSAQPRPTRLLWRGDINNPGPVVPPGVPAVLLSQTDSLPPAITTETSTGQRARLANWIASPENPLTYRVLANRIWQQHFGKGLVASASNFGLNGTPPSHPELLDQLALELVDNGGRIKPLHKMIMLSATYQQSARISEEAARIDPENTLLGHCNLRRLEAELIRDSVLAVSGNLNLEAGGPGIKPRIRADLLTASQRNKWPVVEKEGPAEWRRSVYIYVKRQLLMPMMELFDAPTTTNTCDRREESVLPTQALIMMNDEFVEEQAKHFATRVQTEAGPEFPAQAERALWLALSRKPAPRRVTDAVAFLEQQSQAYQDEDQNEADSRTQALQDLCHVLFNCNEFVYID